MFSFSKFNNNYITYVFFLLFFIVGFNIYKDYGISIDEDNTRINGFVGLKYLFEIFNYDYKSSLNSFPDINEFPEKGIGYVFDVPAALLEYVLETNDPRSSFLLRHLLNFIYFFIGTIFFFLLLKNRFRSTNLALLGTLFLIISPRIFANAFYNNKDIIFLSLFIIASYYSVRTLQNLTYIDSILASIFIGLATGMRILAVFLALLLLFFLIIKYLRNEKKKETTLKIFLSLLILIPGSIILFYPFLWSNPLSNFLFIFERLSNFEWGGYNLYLGDYIKAQNVPWHYSIVWIYATTPILYLILFTFGFVLMIKRIFFRLMNIKEQKKYNDLWRGNKEMCDLFFFSIVFFPILLIILINSTLYSGWRHLYFVYPYIIIIAIYGLNYFDIKYFKKIYKKLYILILISFIININWMYKNHPNQNLYFNYFFKDNFDNLFDLDYWGLSINQNLNFINKNSSNKYKISSIGNMDLELNRKFLEEKDRKRVIIVDKIEDADFIVVNKYYWDANKSKNEKLLDNGLEKIYEVLVDGKTISSVYKNPAN